MAEQNPSSFGPARALLLGLAEVRAARLAAALLLLTALLFALIAWSHDDVFFLRLATEALILSGLAMSVDILLGYVGLLSLGQALYFGLGAYVSALVLKDVAPSFWGAMGACLVTGTLTGLAGGLIAIRAKGVYFALVTFGLAQVVSKIIYNTRAVGASDGLIGIPVIDVPLGIGSVSAADPAGFFLITLAVITVLYAGISYLMDSPFGRVLQAMRANGHRVPFLGYRAWIYKLLAFVLAAQVATLAGGLYPMLRGFVSPELLYFEVSGNAVIATILGGTGTLTGPILGSVILTILKSIIGTFTEHHLIVIGLLFMGAVILMPKGILGVIRPSLEKLVSGKGERP